MADICTKPLISTEFIPKVSKYMFRTSMASQGKKLEPIVASAEKVTTVLHEKEAAISCVSTERDRGIV